MYLQRRIKANETNNELPTISYRFTMNKPFTNILIYQYTHILIFSFMQNEPNFNPNSSSPTSPNGSRATGHESRLMQNEPNLKMYERKCIANKDLRKCPTGKDTHRLRC